MKKQLPKNWLEVSLKEITNNRKGKKPKIQSEVEFEGSIPYMDIKALEHNIIRQYADVESSKLFEEGDIAMVWDGARSGWVSKTNFGAIGSTLVAFQPILFNSNYLFYYLLEKYPFINSNARGVGIPHVDPTVLWDLKFPLPPLPEQDRIVAKLNAYFEQLETIKNSMANVPLLLKDFRQQVLTQAFTGKLTEEWRKGRKLKSIYFYFDDIENDLEDYFNHKMQVSKDNGSVKPRNQNNNKLSDKGDPVLEKIPNDWKYFRAEKLCYLITDGVHFKPTYVENGVKFLSVKNVRPFKINPSDCKYITEDEHKKYIQRCNPENGDILYTKVGATYGYAAKIDLDFDFSIFVSLALIKPSKLINSSYLELLFNSPIIFKQANYKVSGIGVPDLHLIEIRDFKIPLSSPEEQQEIVSRVESLFAKANAIEQLYKSLKDKIDNLPQALLHKAFKGELTEQLVSDGDAKELLKAIEALKATSGKVGKKVGKSVKRYDEKEVVLDMVAEPEQSYKSNADTFTEIVNQLNFDYEIATIVSLTFGRFQRSYGKKYIHKMFSNIELLNSLPKFEALTFEENGWGMFSPQIKKAIEKQKFIQFEEINDDKQVLQLNFKYFKEVSAWMKDEENKEFITQVNDMLSLYENPIINKKMDNIELFNTVLECMKVLKTDNFQAIYEKMKNWPMKEEGFETKADKFKELETQSMIDFIKEIKN